VDVIAGVYGGFLLKRQSHVDMNVELAKKKAYA
jgi:hypothetical protein